MTNKTGTVYVLVDPRGDTIRYVGQTTRTLGQRLSGHLSSRGTRVACRPAAVVPAGAVGGVVGPGVRGARHGLGASGAVCGLRGVGGTGGWVAGIGVAGRVVRCQRGRRDGGSDVAVTETEPSGAEILAVPMGDNDADALTVGDYLSKLLLDLWREGEGFDSKRPFGNSSWEYELYAALGRAGVVGGLDEDGYWNGSDEDEQRARELVERAIKAALAPPAAS